MKTLDEVIKAMEYYTGHDCDDYEESNYTMTQVWDWR